MFYALTQSKTFYSQRLTKPPMDYAWSHNLSCRLCRSHERSKELLEKVKKKQPKVPRCRMPYEENIDPRRFKEVFANIMTTLSTTSACCEDYLSSKGMRMTDRDHSHFSRYHTQPPSFDPLRPIKVRFAASSDNLAVNDTHNTIEDNNDNNEGITQPYTVYGTYDYDDLPEYEPQQQQPLRCHVEACGVLEQTPMPPPSYTTLRSSRYGYSDQRPEVERYKLHAHGSVSFHNDNDDKACYQSSLGGCKSWDANARLTRPLSGGVNVDDTRSKHRYQTTNRYTTPVRSVFARDSLIRSYSKAKTNQVDIHVSNTNNPVSINIDVRAPVTQPRPEKVMRLRTRPPVRPPPKVVDKCVRLRPGQSAKVELVM